MAFIKAQKLVRDSQNQIVSGSASIVESIYVPGKKNHCSHKVRERLGKVISLADDKKSGIFLSPTRGLVAYDAVLDQFSSVSQQEKEAECSRLFPEPEIHTVFGDSYLLIKLLEKQGLLSVFHSVFPKKDQFERLLAHILHGVLKDGSRIGCDDFIEKSYASYLFEDLVLDSLHSDTAFFSMMGDDIIRMSFFREFVQLMRTVNSEFGKGCYVDSSS